MSRKPSDFDNHPAKYPTDTYRAVGRYVVDGDTFDVFVDLGFHHYAYETIRLRGIDTPEIYRPKTDEERKAGYLAKAMVEELLTDSPLRIKTYKDKQSFGRYEADVFVYVEDEWIDLADHMRKSGFDWE